MLFTLACSVGDKEVKTASINLADNLPRQPIAQSADPSSVEQRVYIDSSLSIKGFIGGLPANRTTFDDFIDAMPDLMPGCKVFRYGHSLSQGQATNLKLADITTKAEFDRQLHDPNLYQMQFNPDDALVSGLVAEQRPILSIMLTDGVESDSTGQINTVVVNAIREWLNQGKLFAILILRSRFSGRLYSEHQRSMIDNVTVENRPFYAFVFSPSRREFDDLHEKLRQRFTALRSIVFSDDALHCRMELPTTLGASYANEQPPDKPYYWQMLTMKNLQAGAEDSLEYRVSYDISPTYPIFRLSPYQLS